MLTIRAAQMEALEQDAAAKREARAIEHLQQSSPAYARVLGEETVRRVVRYGTERAASHQIAGEGALWLYLGLMFSLGSDFDRDGQLPWASGILDDAAIPSANTKLEMVSDRALSFLTEVAGAEGEHAIAALHRVRAHPWLSEPARGDRRSAEHIDALLARLHPEKHRVLSDQGTLGALLAAGGAAAAAHGVGEVYAPDGVQMLVVLMFMLGTPVDSDPQYPWVRRLLAEASAPDPTARVLGLCRASLAYIDRVLAEMDLERG